MAGTKHGYETFCVSRQNSQVYYLYYFYVSPKITIASCHPIKEAAQIHSVLFLS